MSFVLRPGLRAAAPLRQQLRSYATEAPKASPLPSSPSPGGGGGGGGGGRLRWIVGGLLVGGGLIASNSWLRRQHFRRNPEDGAKHGRNAGGYPKAFVGGDQAFVSLLLEKSDIVNHNSRLLRFKLPESDMVSGLEVASAVLARFVPVDGEDGKKKPVVRPYTPVSDEDAVGHIDLLVKKYPDGPMSTHLHDMAPGQRLDVKGPLPKYPWTANKHKHIALVAGGTGITPMWQLCRAIFKNPADRTQVTLVLGNVTKEDILLRRELADLENTYPQRFRAFYVLDRPPEGWAGGAGHITKDLLKTVLPAPKDGGDVKVFVCGPPGMMASISGNKVSPRDQGEVSGILKELGYSNEQVYKF